jgi:UDP-N-acetylmuramyl pentapeptide phosphotransferase/UDP-N-acetylglucosamine-1-phosphate transferase
MIDAALEWRLVAATSLLTFLLSFLLVGLARRYFLRRQVLDHPNERSSHSVPIPKGAGWGLLLALLPAVVLAAWSERMGGITGVWLQAYGLAMVLAAVSWWDDLHHLPPLFRLVVQLGVVMVGLGLIYGDRAGQPILPFWSYQVELLMVGFGWLWFINLYNFMDGIDGVSGSQTLFLSVGMAVLMVAFGKMPDPSFLMMLPAMAAAAAGFLCWNWPPAKIFLGDVGSVPLGFLMAFFLLKTASLDKMLWLPMMILPAYYLADASVTLLRRLARREKIWHPHREHFFQLAVRGGLSHAAVVCRVGILNGFLLTLAWQAPRHPVRAPLAALLAVAGLLGLFYGRWWWYRRRGGQDG